MSLGGMRVLHIVSDPSADRPGGSGSFASLVHGQLSTGVKVSVLATLSRQELAEPLMQLGKAGARVILLSPCAPPMLTHPNLHDVVNEAVAQAEVVHIHACWEEVQHAAAAAAQHHRVPYLITPRGLLTRAAMAGNWLKKRLYLALRLNRHLHSASMLHFSDEQEQKETLEAVSVSVPTLVQEAPLDLAAFRQLPESGTFRARFPMLKDRPMLLYHGPLNAQAGVERLVHAFAIVRDRRAVLVIAGGDANGYQDRLIALGRHLDVADRLVLSPALERADAVAALTDADVVALPGVLPDAHRLIIETLAAGTAAVAPQDEATVRLASEFQAVHIFTPATPVALAGALQRAIAQAQASDAVVQDCRRRALEQYDPLHIARRWAQHYHDLCHRRLDFGPGAKASDDQPART